MNNVKSVRLEKGVRQNALAVAAGLSVPLLSNIEKGIRCRQDTARKIAVALEAPVELLFPDFATLSNVHRPHPVAKEVQ